MKIVIPKERHPKENRVAGSPDTVKKLVSMGLEVLIEKDAGHDAMMLDREYQEGGAEICSDAASVFSEADIIIKVQAPLTIPEIGLDEIALLRPGQILIGKLDALVNREQVHAYADKKVTTFALELIPRITRAQNMDILSSQSNIAGYKMVMDAASHFGRMFPTMMLFGDAKKMTDEIVKVL